VKQYAGSAELRGTLITTPITGGMMSEPFLSEIKIVSFIFPSKGGGEHEPYSQPPATPAESPCSGAFRGGELVTPD
jgi:hypothetical protein